MKEAAEPRTRCRAGNALAFAFAFKAAANSAHFEAADGVFVLGWAVSGLKALSFV